LKKIINVFILIIITFFFVACDSTPTKEEAIKFNDKVAADQEKFLDLNNEFLDLYYDLVTDEMTEVLEEIEAFVKEKTEEYETMEAFDEKDILRKAFLDLLEEHTENINDYETRAKMDVVEYLLFTDIALSQQELLKKVEEANSTFLKKQKDFAAQYEFEITESE